MTNTGISARDLSCAEPAFQPSTGAVKKLSKNFAMALAMSEQDVITPLTFGEPNSPARQKRRFFKDLKCPDSSVGRAAD
ncbi:MULTISPECIES: hypothetical protein [Rhizobium]|uniref:hypothetical protein n=1 Tax=Rhizobium TaxID=379 RepID=UPI0010BEFFE1|nr:hypothetical protein CFBP6625_00740 [Agrobacterium tumefaciens]